MGLLGINNDDPASPLKKAMGMGVPIPGVPENPPAPSPVAAPTPMKPAVNLPPVQSSQTMADQSELKRLQDTGSGISQLQKKHGVLGALLRIPEAIGNVVAPWATAYIPGTEMHHRMLLGSQRGVVDQDIQNDERMAQGSEAQARADVLAHPAPKEPTNAFELWHQQNPQGTYEQWQALQQKEAPEVNSPQAGYARAIADAIANGRDPVSDPHVMAWKQAIDDSAKTKEPNRDDKAIAIYQEEFKQKHPDWTDNQTYSAAYNKWVDQTKVNPGVERANAFLGGRVYEVADPDHPGQTMMILGSQIQRNSGTPIAGKGSASVTVPRKEREYMTSGKGGQQLTAFNTAIAHLDTLERLAGDLNNGDIQIVNRAAQEFAKQTGKPAPANFAAAMNAMSGEVASALKASGATDQEIAKVQQTFSNVQSLPQSKGAINTYRELLKSKRDMLRKQDEQAQQGNPNFGDTPEPTRPSNVPANYIYNANGPKGAGWYKPTVTR